MMRLRKVTSCLRLLHQRRIVALIIASSLVFTGCPSGTSNLTGQANGVNAITQAKQTIMVIPSDNMLQKRGALTTSESMGKTLYHRDYQAFLLSGSANQQIITTIQRSFSDSGYPLVDLEQSLKSLENQSALDAADGLVKDAKTLLLTTTRPDIIIEFDYDIATKMISRDKSSTQLSYNIVLLDAFSNKSIGSINNPGTSVDSNDIDNVSALLNKEIKSNLSQLSSQVKTYFSDIATNGREITFTVSLQNGAAINLQDMYNSEGESYGDWIRNWIRVNAKMGTATMQRNTSSEMHFVNVRIENLQDDGQQFNAYDFADKFRREFYKTFQIQVVNNSQGLATAHLVIK
ncbi:MAG: DUF6175 family protein [Rikenellaceae bacterium]